MSLICTLAAKQLEAYNASDLDAFVACFHPEVRLFVGEAAIARGREPFRQHYRSLFEDFAFGAEVVTRIDAGVHCVDLERWWRTHRETGVRDQGTALVHYQARDARIGLVRLLK